MNDPFGSDGGPPPDPFDPYQRPLADSFRTDPYLIQGGPALDGIAVASFVCSLTCCAAPVGIGLGIAGIVRTRDGRRGGRWMAVAGLVLGVLLTLGLAAGATGLVLLGTSTYFFDDARAGDCVDIDEQDDWLDISPADCDEPHDAEVVYAGRFTAELRTSYIEDIGFCHPLAKSAGYDGLIAGGAHRIDPIVESDDVEAPEIGDYFVCVAEAADGDQLTEPLPRHQPSGGDRPGSDETDSDRETISSLDLRRGDCFDEPELDEDDLVNTVTRVPCNARHDYQVVGNVVLPKGRYPGEKALDARSDKCLDLFRDFLDIAYDDSRYELDYYSPTAQSWRKDDDRAITCLAVHPRGRKLTRDLEGIAR